MVKKQKKTGKDFKLNLKQSKFCELYSSSEEFFGNGVQSYIEAYDPKRVGNWYNSAKASAYDNLTKPYLLAYIDYLLELRGLNNPFVDKQLEFLITQNADFRSKLGAIKEYNTLKKRTDKTDKNENFFILGEYLKDVRSERVPKGVKGQVVPTK